MAETLHGLLARNAFKDPQGVALSWPQGQMTMTWRELAGRAEALAELLLARGVKKGERVAIFISNRPEFVVAFFGILQAGAVVVPLNVKLTPPEVAYILQDSGASGLIYEDALRSTAEEALRGLPTMKIILAERELPLRPSGVFNLEVSPADVAEILYTSGTTGKPKGVILTHSAVYLVGSMIAYESDLRFGDVCLHLMPLTHSAPLNLFLVGATWAGAKHVLGTFTPEVFLELVAAERVTHFFGAPVAYALALRVPGRERYDLSSVKRWIYGGAAMPATLAQQVAAHMPAPMLGLYGLTEAGPNGVAIYPWEHEKYAGSIGRRAAVNSMVRLVDDAGRDVPPGTVGEIIIKAPTVMQGYLNRPQETAETLRDGWVYTGDLAVQDQDGYIWVKDRKKDMIITGGVNVYPREVEEVLLLCPGVLDVAVVGVPHPDWGETVLAMAVLEPGRQPQEMEQQIKEFCRKSLADYKIPRLFQFVDAIPRNASGKILKHVIRAEYVVK
ncbi:class I adenylate-forming enzyme family protein [Desulfurispora thermophila]|uniref:class I adenylate-forming enzyme family protein n=1 Tax=Desulfurispora thermophila TaxID=265470 RepID=UPI00035F6F33|nr:AMP-binding protein [Desulfurispora thermophila]